MHEDKAQQGEQQDDIHHDKVMDYISIRNIVVLSISNILSHHQVNQATRHTIVSDLFRHFLESVAIHLIYISFVSIINLSQ